MLRIPEEICLDIILRLPVKSVLACKCVCKNWYSLISKPNFIKSHLNLSIQKKNYSLILKGYGEGRPSPNIICSISCDDTLNDLIEDPVEFDYPFNSLGYDVILWGSCNGLVFLQVLYKGFLCLWNPCTKEYKRIPDSPNQVLEKEISGYAFGYDSQIDDYKLFKFVEPDGGENSLVDVYALRSNSWRTIEDIPYKLLYAQNSGVLFNQSLHWLGSKINTHVEEISAVIISVDISNEIFEEIQLPEVRVALDNVEFFMCLGVLEGCLCVLVSDGSSKVGVWIMQDYGVHESWTKHFDIIDDEIRNCHFLSLLWSFKNDEVVLQAGDDLVIYDREQMGVRKPKISIFSCLDLVENHVESLVSLYSGTYVERQQIDIKPED